MTPGHMEVGMKTMRQSAEKLLGENNSLYTVIAVKDSQTVGMGKLIGDGMYYTIVDIVLQPNYQKQGSVIKLSI